MSEKKHIAITVSNLKTYLFSLEKEKEQRKRIEIRSYGANCNTSNIRTRRKEIIRIEREIDREFAKLIGTRETIIKLLDELKDIPKDIEQLEVTEYMIYRVDLRKAEKIINKASKKLEKRYEEIQETVEDFMYDFPEFDGVDIVDYTEYDTDRAKITGAKDKYKLEYTDEERLALVQKELDNVDKTILFNSVPIPHEILKNSDKDIQFKMQKFNSIRQKRIRILSSMKEDYKKLMEPRELMQMVDDALDSLDDAKEILTKTEYNSVRRLLIKRRKRIYRSTNDVRMMITSKEKKAGIANINIQQARYQRMEFLRQAISEASNLIKANPITEPEEQLEKLKTLYEREKQFASVIERLNDEKTSGAHTEVKAYEERIRTLEYTIANSKKIVSEQKRRIIDANKELLILWTMEITMAVSRKKEVLELSAPKERETPMKSEQKAVEKLKKISGSGKHACT